MKYQQGLHILSEIHSAEEALLKDYQFVKTFLNEKVDFLQLTSVGEVFHNFEGGGYTGVICLTESHLAIHTWPEYGIITLDIYLSNCKKVNDEKSKFLFDEIIRFFNSDNYTRQDIHR